MKNDGSPRFGDRKNGETEGREDLVQRLVSLADVGPEVPADGADRIRAAIRPVWQAEVRARRRRRSALWVGGGLAAAAVVAAITVTFLRTSSESPITVATLATLIGQVGVVETNGVPTVLTAGDLGRGVVAGSWLETGDSSRAALRLHNDQSLRLDVGTRVRLSSEGALDLERGAVYLDSGGRHGGSIEVWTDLGVARDIGTRFEVRRDGADLIVRVRDGAVAVNRDQREEIEIRRGTMVTISIDGSSRTERLPAHAAAWGWTQEIAPPFDIEGRSVVAFLDWVSKETGLEVSFADLGVERLAGDTVLHGSIDGLRPADAPNVVLPGCGLEAVRESGTLEISRSGD